MILTSFPIVFYFICICDNYQNNVLDLELLVPALIWNLRALRVLKCTSNRVCSNRPIWTSMSRLSFFNLVKACLIRTTGPKSSYGCHGNSC